MTTKREFKPRVMPQQNVGKAYAFFDCPASREEIKARLPEIREMAQTPNELELSLTEGDNKLQRIAVLRGDKLLHSIAKKADEVERKYCLEASYPNQTNKKTYEELTTLLNTAYTTDLFPVGKFHREVLYYNDEEQDWFVIE